MWATWSGVVTNSASIILTGSPGTRNSMLKTARVTPRRTGTAASARPATKLSTPRPPGAYFLIDASPSTG